MAQAGEEVYEVGCFPCEYDEVEASCLLGEVIVAIGVDEVDVVASQFSFVGTDVGYDSVDTDAYDS